MGFHYCPGPDSDLSMNFFLAKQSHHLDGFPSSDPKTLSQTRTPVSCRICCRYCLIRSEKQAPEHNKLSHALQINSLHLRGAFNNLSTRVRKKRLFTKKYFFIFQCSPLITQHTSPTFVATTLSPWKKNKSLDCS